MFTSELVCVASIFVAACTDGIHSDVSRDTQASLAPVTSAARATLSSGGLLQVTIGAREFKTDTWQGVLRLFVGGDADFATLQLGGSARTGDSVGVTLNIPVVSSAARMVGSHLIGEEGPLSVQNGVLVRLGGALNLATAGFVEITSHSAGQVDGSFHVDLGAPDGDGRFTDVRGDFRGLVQVVCMAPIESKSRPVSWIQVPPDDERCFPYLAL